jgi:hypothetical protein
LLCLWLAPWRRGRRGRRQRNLNCRARTTRARNLAAAVRRMPTPVMNLAMAGGLLGAGARLGRPMPIQAISQAGAVAAMV